jgi:hypothetical protein
VRQIALAIVITLVLAACGGDDSTGGGAAQTDGDEQAATSTTADGSCPEETSLEVANSDGGTGFSGDPVDLDAGPIETMTGFADTTGGNAQMVFADYAFEEDPQFGLSAPVGDPEAPDGGLYFMVSITTGGEGDLAPGEYRALEPGEGAVSSPGDLTDPDADIPDIPPSVNFEIMYLGAERIVIGNHAVTLTEVTDSRLCGEITTDADETDLEVLGQSVITGDFAIDRV